MGHTIQSAASALQRLQTPEALRNSTSATESTFVNTLLYQEVKFKSGFIQRELLSAALIVLLYSDAACLADLCR